MATLFKEWALAKFISEKNTVDGFRMLGFRIAFEVSTFELTITLLDLASLGMINC